ncbi:response regulator [Chondrinema litorale]|uniref:response regulator n=1 Tax=Chondrinema litorale TaxID=2994555 RepID=UPI002542EA6D|nr:response regulator [Chondrinema litorale]UZR98155.1 response regulator [Chondrinema litorale]
MNIDAKDYERTFNVLHIEDNEADCLIFKELLSEKNQNTSITNCFDGEEAINYLQNNANQKPDIIILDLNIPKITGIEVLTWLKHNKQMLHIPVIILTTSILENDIVNCYKNYANCYLRKPKNLNEYISIADRINKFWLETVVLINSN